MENKNQNTCNCCKEIKDIPSLNKNKHYKDGLNYYCEDCKCKTYIEKEIPNIKRYNENREKEYPPASCECTRNPILTRF